MSALTFRDTKGSPLTSIEADANVRALAQKTGTTPQLSGAVTGTGKYNSPLVSADGTAGMQAAIASFDEGGELELGIGLHRVTTPLVIQTPSVGGHGLRAGFNIDPNASVLGLHGTRVQVAGTCFKWGNLNDGERIGNVGWEKTYFYGNYSGANSIVHRFDGRLDQPFFTRNHYSNFSYVYFMPPGVEGGNLDTATFQNEDALYNNHIFYDDGSRPSFFTKILYNCYSDGFGYGIYVGNTNRATPEFYCQEYVVEGNTFARLAINGGAAVEMVAPGTRIEGNNFRDTGWNFLTGARAVADDLRLRGNSMVATGNIFRGNTKGINVVVDANDCQVLFNSYAGDVGHVQNGGNPVNSSVTGTSSSFLPIHIKPGRKRTIVWEPTLAGNQIKDEGEGSIINGLCVMSGDPDNVGPWANFPKPVGVRFFDKASGSIYEYNAAFDGGRRKTSATASTAPALSAGARANQLNKNYYTCDPDYATGSVYIARPTAWVDAGETPVFENRHAIGVENSAAALTIRVTMPAAGFIDFYARTLMATPGDPNSGLGTGRATGAGQSVDLPENTVNSADGVPTQIGSLALPAGDTDISLQSITKLAFLLEKFRLRA